jgi:hypothetical protein
MKFNIHELSDEQNRLVIDMEQAYAAYIDAVNSSHKYNGNMRWQKSRGKEYLVKGRGSKGYGKSLGPREPATEKIYNKFVKGKEENKKRIDSLKNRINELSRYAKAARVQRMPITPARVLRHLEKRDLPYENIIVSGTNCIYAYEAKAGVRVGSKLLATQDLDMLWDNRNDLKLIPDPDISRKGLIGIIRKAERSFKVDKKNKYRAVNKDGYRVELISPLIDMRKKSVPVSDYEKDLVAAEIEGLRWLVSSPKVSQIVIDESGWPVTVTAPIPPVFVLYKLWLSNRTDRARPKRQRDRHQALVIAKITIDYLPEYKFNKDNLQALPHELVEKGSRELKKEGIQI